MNPDNIDDEYDFDAKVFPEDLPENLQMLVSANWEAAKEMPLSQMSVIVLEGIFNLLTHLGTVVDEEMAQISPKDLSIIVDSRHGKTILGCMTEFAVGMTTILSSIDQLRAISPKEYDKIVKDFQSMITSKIAQKEDEIVEEFMRSIPDTLPPEDAASE
jgi:hypothetical protein